MTDTMPSDNIESSSEVVACIQKNDREAICVATGTWKGQEYISLRTYVPSLSGDDLIPIRKGFNLPVEKYRELLDGLVAVADVSAERVVAKIVKSTRYQVWVSFRTYKQIPLVDVRTFVQRDGEWTPTEQGVAVRLELYTELLEAVKKLGEHPLVKKISE